MLLTWSLSAESWFKTTLICGQKNQIARMTKSMTTAKARRLMVFCQRACAIKFLRTINCLMTCRSGYLGVMGSSFLAQDGGAVATQGSAEAIGVAGQINDDVEASDPIEAGNF